MKRLVLPLVVILLASAATARQFDTNDGRCPNHSTDPGLRFGACTWLIDSGRLQENSRPVPYRDRGNANFTKGDYNRAIEVASRTIPNSDQLFDANIPIAYANRGNAYFVKQQYDRAIADYDTAIRLDPNFAAAYYNRGLAYGHKRQYDRAAADFSFVIRLQLDHAKAYNSLAWLLATASRSSIRNGARAVESALRAVSLKDIAEYRDTLAAAYAEAGRFTEAVREQKRAITMARQEGISDLAGWLTRLRHYKRGYPFRE